MLAAAIDGNWTAGAADGGGRLGEWANNWVVVPGDLATWVTPVSYIGLVAAVLTLTVLHGRARLVLLVPTLYLAAFVWENVMLVRPEPTRFVVLGAILIAVMIARPKGCWARSAWRSYERRRRQACSSCATSRWRSAASR